MKNNYKNFKLKTAFALLAFLGFQHNAMAQSMATINVSEDTFVDAKNTSDNNGAAADALGRDLTSSQGRITFYKFPVNAGGLSMAVSKATLTFYSYGQGGTDPTEYEFLEIHKLPSTWMENDVTWDDKPDTGDLIGEKTITIVSSTDETKYRPYTLDVTAYFNEILATTGATDISFAIYPKEWVTVEGGPTTGYKMRLGTKDSAETAAASIEIEYTLGVDDISNNQSPLQVYPNPTTSSFTLNRTFKSSDVLEVSVFNLLGAKVSSFSETVQPGVWKKEFNTQQLNMVRGLYLLKVSSKVNGTSVSKLVVK